MDILYAGIYNFGNRWIKRVFIKEKVIDVFVRNKVGFGGNKL